MDSTVGRRPPDFGQVLRTWPKSGGWRPSELAGCLANGHLAGRVPGKRPSRVAALAERMANVPPGKRPFARWHAQAQPGTLGLMLANAPGTLRATGVILHRAHKGPRLMLETMGVDDKNNKHKVHSLLSNHDRLALRSTRSLRSRNSGVNTSFIRLSPM